MKLSQKLRELREEKELTQQALADKLGIGIQSIRNYENDSLDRIPNTVQLKMLKDFYGVTYEYLLDEDCNNKTVETAPIGKELKLSDKALDKIINLQYRNRHIRELVEYLVPDDETPVVFNDWIEKSDVQEYLVLISEYQSLNKILEILQYFSALNSFYKNISDLLNDKDSIKYILSVLENKLEEFKEAVYNSIFTTLKDHGYDAMNFEVDKLRKFLKNYKKESVNVKKFEEIMIFIQSIGVSYQEETSRSINYCLFEITEVLKNELHEFYSVDDNLTIPSEYQKLLKKEEIKNECTRKEKKSNISNRNSPGL